MVFGLGAVKRPHPDAEGPDQKRPYRKVEAHLAYKITNPTPATVTFAWRNSNGPLQTASHVYAPQAADDATWAFDAGPQVKTLWVEYSAK